MKVEPEAELFQRAKKAVGWEKVEILNRLAGTENPEIKRWLVCEGYRDEWCGDDLAFVCATSGELLSELKKPTPDPKVLIAAGRILEALIEGYGFHDISHYDDGPDAVELYITHLANQPDLTLAELRTIAGIADFVDEGHYTYEWDALLPKGWSQDRRDTISSKAKAILIRPEWKQKILTELKKIHDPSFDVAAFVGQAIGIDVTPYQVERLSSQRGKSTRD
jgi:hypothetical protein